MQIVDSEIASLNLQRTRLLQVMNQRYKKGQKECKQASKQERKKERKKGRKKKRNEKGKKMGKKNNNGGTIYIQAEVKLLKCKMVSSTRFPGSECG